MADHACDLDLSTGLNDGTSWANAYQTLTAALSGASAGDTIYLQGSLSYGTTTHTSPGTKDNPVRVIGVKDSASPSTLPPAESELVDNYSDAQRPVIQSSGTSILHRWNGFFYFWGVRFTGIGYQHYGYTTDTGIVFEECLLQPLYNRDITFGEDGFDTFIQMLNCQMYLLDADNPNIKLNGSVLEMRGGDIPSNDNILIISSGANGSGGTAHFIGVDMSDIDTVMSTGIGNGMQVFVDGCKMKSGWVPATTSSFDGWSGVADTKQTDYVASQANPVVAEKRINNFGTVEHEGTIVRSGGSSDGTTSHSQKMTLKDNSVIEYSVGLRSRGIHKWCDNTGSATTFTVYIYNATGDLQDDEVWLELFYPGNDNTQLFRATTKAASPGVTPSNVADDSSTWNGSSNYAQKLEITTDGSALPHPDHEGECIAFVYFQKRGASVQSLYVDNNIYIS